MAAVVGRHLKNNWQTYATIAGLGICIFMSAGACVIAGGILAGVNYGVKGEKYGYRSSRAVRGLVWDLGTVGAGGYAAKGLSAGYRLAANGKRSWGSAWKIRDKAGWFTGPAEKVGTHSGARHRVGPQHGTRRAITSRASIEGYTFNTYTSTSQTLVQMAGAGYFYG